MSPSPMFATRTLLCAAVVFLLLSTTGCGMQYGRKVKVGDIEVYYTEGATKEEAERLANNLSREWDGYPGKKSAQINKTVDGYAFRLVVRKEFQNNEMMLKQMQFDAARISRDVFAGAAVELHACDEYFKTLRVFPPRPDVRYGVVEGKVEVFYPSISDKDDAQRLATYLARELTNAPSIITFKLARHERIVELHMVVKPETMNNPFQVQGLQEEGRRISQVVFNGAPLEMHLCDDRLNVLKVLNP